MSEVFTNRRGNKQLVEDELMVEAPIVKPVKAELPRPTPSKSLRRPRRSHRLPWLWLIIGTAGVIVLGLLTLETVRLGYVSSISSTRARLQEIVTVDITPALKQPQISSQTISSFIDKFESASKALCPGGLLDNFASAYPRSKQAYDDCATYRSNVESFIAALNELQVQTAYLEKLGPLLNQVSQSLPDRFAVLAAQQENWKTLSDNLASLTPSPALQPPHRQLVDRVKIVNGLWIDLVAATNSQDSARFIAARDKLPAAYAELRASAEEFETVLSTTQTTLSNAYSRL